MQDETRKFLEDTDKYLDNKLKDLQEQNRETRILGKIEILFGKLTNYLVGEQAKIIDAVSRVKIEQPKIDVYVPKVEIPEIKIPEIKIPEIKIPEIRLPEIRIPEIKSPEVKIPEIKIPEIPKPDIQVNIPEIKVPEVKVKLPEKMKIEGNVRLTDINRDNPLPVILTDEDGNFYKAVMQAISGGGSRNVAIKETVLPAINHGAKSSIGTSAVQMYSTSITTKSGVLVKAANGNTGKVYVGTSVITNGSADATDGFELGAGESISIPIDNVNKIYLIGSAADQKVFWLII